MSQPNKRSYTTISTTTSTTCTGGAGVGNHKSHLSTCGNAEGQVTGRRVISRRQERPTHQSPHVHFAPDIESAVVDDPNSMIEDPNPTMSSMVLPSWTCLHKWSHRNLSRKKATPPQPAKKLVIKLVK
ncbi:unnamed protein product, partial [Ilex paraguariensis]